jgi:hypothetical protein
LRQDRHHRAVRLEADQRLVAEPRAVGVLEAGGEVRVQQRRRLPPERTQRTAAATPRRCPRGLLRGGARERHRHAERGERAEERAASRHARQRSIARNVTPGARNIGSCTVSPWRKRSSPSRCS